MSNGIKPTKHILAYIDFLGTKEKIQNDIDNQHLLFLKNLYEYINREIKKNNEKDETIFKNIKIRSFSDNVLFAVSANCNQMQLNYALGEFIRICSNIQVKALKQNILTRGGICIDNVYINDNLVYGSGLIRVLTLEEDVAHYPRIIIDEKLCLECEKYILSNKNTTKDQDNISYINSYNTLHLEKPELIECKYSLLEQIQKYKNNIKFMSKIDWAIQYHNRYIDESLNKNSDLKITINTPSEVNEEIIKARNLMKEFKEIQDHKTNMNIEYKQGRLF